MASANQMPGRFMRMKALYTSIYIAIVCTGCVATTDHHYPKLGDAADYQNTLSAPLTAQDIERAKKAFDHLGPYMTTDECFRVLGLPKRLYPTSADGPRQRREVSMMLAEGHMLGLVIDGRGYVITALLDEKKWEWTNDKKE